MPRTPSWRIAALSTLLVAAAVTTAGHALGMFDPAPQQDQRQQPPQGGAQFPDLGKGLRETPGCLGVEFAQTQSGRRCIFAWFKDKQSVVQWYYSDMHQNVMGGMTNSAEFGKPLEHVADDAGPIMVIASLVMSDRPQHENVNIPISEIAIELYTPLPGGATLGGRFTPMTVDIPQMQIIDAPAGDDARE